MLTSSRWPNHSTSVSTQDSSLYVFAVQTTLQNTDSRSNHGVSLKRQTMKTIFVIPQLSTERKCH